MPKAIVILPSGTYRAQDFIKAADSLGIDLVVASEQPPPIDMGDRYLQIDCSDPDLAAEALTALADRVPVDGVVAADDPGVVIAALAAERLGLPGNPPEGAAATRDKLSMRRMLTASEVDQPRYAAAPPGVDVGELASSLGFPVVIKPLDRTASQGVIRADDPDQAVRAANRVREIVADETATLVVEELVGGAEIALEGMVHHGELRVLAVFDKPDTSDGPYFPETIFVTPSRLDEPLLALAARQASAAVRALGLLTGPVHVEMRVSGTRAWIIEVAARSIGGLCSRSLNFGLMGTSLESLILRNALGLDVGHLRRESIASGVLMVPTPGPGVVTRIVGETETRAIEGVTGIDLTVVSGASILAPPEGDRYLGFVYARAAKPELVEEALRKAMTTLEVQLEG